MGHDLHRHVERDFARYLEWSICARLCEGALRVLQGRAARRLLVQERGCAPPAIKRAHVPVVHLVERVLPCVPDRQRMLSFPHRVRWVLLKKAGLFSGVLTIFLFAVFELQRRIAGG